MRKKTKHVCFVVLVYVFGLCGIFTMLSGDHILGFLFVNLTVTIGIFDVVLEILEKLEKDVDDQTHKTVNVHNERGQRK